MLFGIYQVIQSFPSPIESSNMFLGSQHFQNVQRRNGF